MRASQERLQAVERARSASHHSSDKPRSIGKRDYAEDAVSDVNDRDFGGTEKKRQASIKLTRDASAQAVE